MGELIENILASKAKMEKIENMRRMNRGKGYRAANGDLSGAPVPFYGYRWEDDYVGHGVKGMRTRYVEDPDSAEVVRRIYTWGAEGKPTRWIARQLNAEHIMTPSAYAAHHGHGGRRKMAVHWHPEMVRRILNDEAYKGVGVAFRWIRDLNGAEQYIKNADGVMEENGKTLRLRAEDDSERVPLPETTWPALVDEPLWNAVQQRMGKDGPNAREASRSLKNAEAYLLRGGHIFCGVCKSAMEGARRPDGAYIYRCPRRPATVSSPELACAGRGQTIRAHIIHEAAWADARYALEHAEDLKRTLYARMEGDAPEDHLAGYVGNLDAQLSEKRAQRSRMIDRQAMTEDPDTATALMEKIDTLSRDIREMDKERAAAGAQLAARDERQRWAQTIMDRIMEVTGDPGQDVTVRALISEDKTVYTVIPRLDSLSYEEKRQALYLLGLRTYIYPTDHEYTRAHNKRWKIEMDLAGADEDGVETQTSSNC